MMPYPEYRWLDTAFGGPHRRNHLMTVDQLRAQYPTGQTDCYRSAFRFPAAMRAHFHEHKSVLGYRGPVFADWLYLDIDCADDLQQARAAACEVVATLVATGVESAYIWPYFSGCKGFHILVPQALFGWEPSEHLPLAFRILVEDLFGAKKLPLDMALYEPVRLLRLTNTRHGKTGLFKIPLTVDELRESDIDGLRALAERPREGIPRRQPSGAHPGLQQRWKSALHRAQRSGPTGGTPPTELAQRVREGMGPGNRHPTLASIAGHLIARGVDRTLALELLLCVNAVRCQPPKPEQEIYQLVEGLLRGEANRHPDRATRHAVREVRERYRLSRTQAEALLRRHQAARG